MTDLVLDPEATWINPKGAVPEQIGSGERWKFSVWAQHCTDTAMIILRSA